MRIFTVAFLITLANGAYGQVTCQSLVGGRIQSVDWWLAYVTTENGKAFLLDDRLAGGDWRKFNVDGEIGNPLRQTLDQFYVSKAQFNTYAVAYSNAAPKRAIVKSNLKSHSKGLFMWNGGRKAVAIVHTIARFPDFTDIVYSYPSEMAKKAALALCLTISVVETAKWARQLQYEEVFVYYSQLPPASAGGVEQLTSHEMISFVQGKQLGITPYKMSEKLRTINGRTVQVFGKMSKLNEDIYSTLVRRHLRSSLVVWGSLGVEKGYLPSDCNDKYKVENINDTIALEGVKIGADQDSSTWLITRQSEANTYWCLSNSGRTALHASFAEGVTCLDDSHLHRQFSRIASNASVEECP